MQLEIILSAGSPKPIYEQIEAQFKAQILSGALEPGQAIPSMRARALAAHQRHHGAESL